MKKLIIISILIILFVLGIIILHWISIYVGIKLSPDPLEPVIKYGEFPFSLEYEIDGQRKVIEDTVICEYDGIGMNEGVGKYRKWKSRLGSGSEDIILLKIDDTKELIYPTGSAEYYMGDSRYGYSKEFREAVLYKTNGNTFRSTTITAEELLDKYKIVIISWDASEPIENKFTETD